MLRISVMSPMKQQISQAASMTKIGIIGSKGRMGQALVAAIAEAGFTHAGGVDQGDDLANLVAASDVLVDFSSPHALEANLDICITAGKAIVIGTTGLEERHHYLIDSAAKDIAVWVCVRRHSESAKDGAGVSADRFARHLL